MIFFELHLPTCQVRVAALARDRSGATACARKLLPQIFGRVIPALEIFHRVSAGFFAPLGDDIFVVILVRLDSICLALLSNVPVAHQLSGCHGLVDDMVGLLRAVAAAPLECHDLQLILVDGREVDRLYAIEALCPLEEGHRGVGGLARLLVHFAAVGAPAACEVSLLEHSVVVIQCLGLLSRLYHRV